MARMHDLRWISLIWDASGVGGCILHLPVPRWLRLSNALAFTRERPSAADRQLQRHVSQHLYQKLERERQQRPSDRSRRALRLR